MVSFTLSLPRGLALLCAVVRTVWADQGELLLHVMSASLGTTISELGCSPTLPHTVWGRFGHGLVGRDIDHFAHHGPLRYHDGNDTNERAQPADR
jgi:hypothetical protein